MPTDTIELDEIPVAVGYFDADERSVFTNATAGRWMGISPDEMRGRSVREIVGEELYRERRPHIEAVLSGVVDQLDGIVSYPDGTARRVCMTFSPDRRDGRVVGFFVTTIDLDVAGGHAAVGALHDSLVATLTERLGAEEALEETSASVKALLDSIKGLLAEVRRKLGTT